VIATTSSDAKAARLKELGADEVVNHRTTPDWHLAVRRLTGGRGVDQVVETVGGTLEKSIRATAVEGLVSFIGRLDSGTTTLDTSVLYGSIASVRVVPAGSRAQFIAMTGPSPRTGCGRSSIATSASTRCRRPSATSRPRRRSARWSSATADAPDVADRPHGR